MFNWVRMFPNIPSKNNFCSSELIFVIGKIFAGRNTHFGKQVARPKFTLEARFFRATVRLPLL
jgi:hypothetical protein